MSSKWKTDTQPKLEGTVLGELVSNLMKLKEHYEEEERKLTTQIHSLERVHTQLKAQEKGRKDG